MFQQNLLATPGTPSLGHGLIIVRRCQPAYYALRASFYLGTIHGARQVRSLTKSTYIHATTAVPFNTSPAAVPPYSVGISVSYTHLTLPTIYSV